MSEESKKRPCVFEKAIKTELLGGESYEDVLRMIDEKTVPEEKRARLREFVESLRPNSLIIMN